MREQELIAVLLESRDNYERFKPLLKEQNLTAKAKWLIDQIGAYYTSTGAKSAPIADFEKYFFTVRAGHLKPTEAELYETLFRVITSKKYSTELYDSILEHYVTLDYSNKIQDVTEKVISGATSDLNPVIELLEKWESEVKRAVKLEDLFASADVSEIASKVSAPGLEWRLPELNYAVGPLRKGDFGIVAARPETGKTTLMAAEITFMASQLPEGGKILWVNNEEQSEKVMFRLIQAACGVDTKTLLADLTHYQMEYERIVGADTIMVTRQDLDPTYKDVEAIIKKVNPSLVVFDQLDKVRMRGHRDEREDERLGRLYLWGRSISARHCPVLAVSQVNATGEGQRWLTQAQLRGSNTDKAAEADLIITLGRDHGPGFEDTRFLNIAKNKLFGGPKTVASLRHGKFEITIQPDIARYKGTMA